MCGLGRHRTRSLYVYPCVVSISERTSRVAPSSSTTKTGRASFNPSRAARQRSIAAHKADCSTGLIKILVGSERRPQCRLIDDGYYDHGNICRPRLILQLQKKLPTVGGFHHEIQSNRVR